MKRFKKIYIEITNQCNLKCHFCIKNQRKCQYLSKPEFQDVLNRVGSYTDYLYFHVMGEPLLHPQINEFIALASQRFKVNITTNGYLIEKIKDNNQIRQLNISLHSYDEKNGIELNKYLEDILNVIDSISFKNTYISLRFWVKNKNHKAMIDYLNKHYSLEIPYEIKNYKINNHIFINNFHEFIWPDLSNNFQCSIGHCYALKEHIAILVDGTVVPCCLDSKGIINLGNIYKDYLENILESDRAKKMLNGFQKHIKEEKLCQHCNFIEK